MILFVYGSLMSKFKAKRLPSRGLKYLGDAEVEGSIFDLNRFPAIKLGGGGRVKGELHEVVDEAVIPALDRYEGCIPGHPARSLYNRVESKTTEGVDIILYEYSHDVKPAVRIPSGDWYSYVDGNNRM